jgi:hypothetical protein
MIRSRRALAGIAAALCMAPEARAQDEAFGGGSEAPAPMEDPVPEETPEAPDVIGPEDQAPPRPPSSGEDFAPAVPAGEPEEDSTVETADDFGGDDKHWHGLLGPLRVGPTVQLGVPHLLSYGVDLLYDRRFGFGFSTGKATTTLVDPIKLQIAHWDVRARWHPRTSPFFVGLACGEQRLVGRAEDTLSPKLGDVELRVQTSVQVTATTVYLTPHIGWFEMAAGGLTIGAELGAQVPVGSRTSTEAAFENVAPSQVAAIKRTKEYSDFEKKVDDARKLLGSTTLPYVTLLRLGWLL